MTKYHLENKEEAFREFALNGDVWKVVLKIGLPLCFYQMMMWFFRVIDSMMASYVGSSSVSAVAFLAQLNGMISSVGAGIAVGGSIEISRAYGLGDYTLVKNRVSTLYCITSGICFLVLLMIPFSGIILRLVNTPQELILIGSKYFSIELFNLVLVFYNNVYFSIERVRGNTKRILYLNVVSVLIKLSLSSIFVYVLKSDIQMIAASNIISQAFILIIGLINLNNKESIFKLSFSHISFKKRVVQPMLHLGFPVVIEKVAFNLGKVLVNSMSTVYGSLAVGALGISNTISGITVNPQIGFQDAGSAIISQNLGAGKKERSIDVFYKILIANIIIGIIGLFFSLTFIEALTAIFSYSSKGNDVEFQNMIITMYRYEVWGSCIPLAVTASVTALLLGFGYSKLTLLINFCRVFVFRVPVLYFLQNYTSLGYETCGIIMSVSNLCISVMCVIIAFIVIKQIRIRIKEESEFLKEL